MDEFVWTVLAIIGWLLFVVVTIENYFERKHSKKLIEAHKAELRQEFHRSFKAGWDAFANDAGMVRTQYNRLFHRSQE